MRDKLFKILEPAEAGDAKSKIYDLVMFLSIICSLAPLVTHEEKGAFLVMDVVTCVIFIIDYILRWVTADIASGRRGVKAFILYPFTPMAIVDLLSILPTLSLISPVFKVFRMSRLLKVLRVFKFIRYYEPLQITVAVIRKEAKTLAAVLLFAVFYIVTCALVMFNVGAEPGFETFFDAVYWAACTLTTVGYGDLYPVSTVGRAFSMLSAVVGIALIALPSGIITSGYMEEMRVRKERKDSK